MKGVLVLLVGILILGCTQVSPEKLCELDAECVASACCHADDAVNKDYAPECGDLFCTSECQPNTLDCQQGEVKCIKNECVAVLNG
jgi:hypothetical protein